MALLPHDGGPGVPHRPHPSLLAYSDERDPWVIGPRGVVRCAVTVRNESAPKRLLHETQKWQIGHSLGSAVKRTPDAPCAEGPRACLLPPSAHPRPPIHKSHIQQFPQNSTRNPKKNKTMVPRALGSCNVASTQHHSERIGRRSETSTRFARRDIDDRARPCEIL